MSYIQEGGGAGGAGTVTNTGGALTANAVVLGAGGNDEKVTTAFTTNGTTTLTIGVAAGGNGVLALAGNTSGTATITAPAVAGTSTNQMVVSNVIGGAIGTIAAPAYSFSTSTGTGFYQFSSGNSAIGYSAAGVASMILAQQQFRLRSDGLAGFTPSTDPSVGVDTNINRFGAGILGVGTAGATSRTGLIQSAMSTFVTTNFTTSGVGTALEAITGLSITVPATTANWTFHAHLAYSQAVGAAAVAFGIQAVTNAPTNIFATGEQQVTAGPPATIVTGTLATLATTTATNIVTGTPGAAATTYTCDLYGTCELGASANTIRLLVSTAVALDLVTVLRGSYFTFNC